MEDAASSGRELAGGEVLAVGYGSGDAAEAIPMMVAEGWREAAERIGFAEALTNRPWRRCGRTDLEAVRDEFLALRWTIRRKSAHRSVRPPSPKSALMEYRHAAEG